MWAGPAHDGPTLGFFGELGGRMCGDNKRKEDFQNLLGTQMKIINLCLKIAAGLKSLKNLEGGNILEPEEQDAYYLGQTPISVSISAPRAGCS